MKVLVINSSPMMEKGNTEMILNPLLEGMKYAGAEVELFYSKKLHINPCDGEHSCWFKNPGICYQDDDMQMLYPKFKDSEIWVFATPLYWGGITSSLKIMMDRLLPLLEASVVLKNDHCHQVLRNDVKKGKVVIVSTCGLWEVDNFYPMLAHMRTFCKGVERELVGALLRPHASELRRIKEIGSQTDDVIESARNAGQDLILKGEMSALNYNKISKELVSKERFINISNRGFQTITERPQSKWI